MSHRSNTKVIDLRALPFCRPENKIYYNILCRLIKNQTEEPVEEHPARKKRFKNSRRNPEETKEEDIDP